MFNPNINSLIICDQVRREDNGKELILGVYSGNILFQSFPLTFVFTIFIGFDSDPFEAGEFKVTVELEDGSFSELEGSVAGNADEPIQGALITPAMSVEVQQPTTLTVKAIFGEGEARILGKKRIMQFPRQD